MRWPPLVLLASSGRDRPCVASMRAVWRALGAPGRCSGTPTPTDCVTARPRWLTRRPGDVRRAARARGPLDVLVSGWHPRSLGMGRGRHHRPWPAGHGRQRHPLTPRISRHQEFVPATAAGRNDVCAIMSIVRLWRKYSFDPATAAVSPSHKGFRDRSTGLSGGLSPTVTSPTAARCHGACKRTGARDAPCNCRAGRPVTAIAPARPAPPSDSSAALRPRVLFRPLRGRARARHQQYAGGRGQTGILPRAPRGVRPTGGAVPAPTRILPRRRTPAPHRAASPPLRDRVDGRSPGGSAPARRWSARAARLPEPHTTAGGRSCAGGRRPRQGS